MDQHLPATKISSANDNRKRRVVVSGAILFTILGLICWGVACKKKAPVAKIKPFVRGYMAVRVPQAGKRQASDNKNAGKDIYIPRLKVHLLNLGDNSKGDAVTTDLSGRFTLPAAAGRYQVCWESDSFDSGCANNPVTVTTAPVHLSTVRIDIKRREEATLVYGNVKLSDGSSFRLLEPMGDVNVFGSVALLDENKAQRQEALVNNFGDYLLPHVPSRAHLFLAARVQQGVGVQEVRPEANLRGAAFHEIDLTIDNAPPRVDPLVLHHASGEHVQVANPGETLKLEAKAEDPDGDKIDFQWLVDPGSGNVSSPTGQSVEWRMPATDGLYSLAMIASDGKGGFSRRALSVRVDRRGVVFSGTVLSAGGGALSDAVVTINDQSVKTDAAGFFRSTAPVSKRYVLNIRKPGFSLISRILDRGLTGGRFVLRPATVTSVNAAADIDVQDRRSKVGCPGPASLKFDGRTFPGGVRPIRQDGKRKVIAMDREESPSLARYFNKEGCGPGVRVRIPANSLQDDRGNAPAGNVDISLSTIDLMSPDQMPGDYTVEVGRGTQVMESYGAAIVEISSGGTEFNLKPGATAELIIPVDSAQLMAGGTIPASIPILYYDEQKGVWSEDKSVHASLQGNTYVAKVSHFSPINADVLKIGQACVRVDASHDELPGNFRMQVIVPMGTSAPRVLDQPIDNSLETEHVVYNLPINTNITLAPYDPVTNIPFGTFVVNTGGSQNPTDPNLPFGPEYTACSTLVEIIPQTLPIVPISGEFLHGITSFNATSLVESDITNPGTLSGQLNLATTAYYNKVDPNGTRQNLDGINGFKTVHGMGAGGPGCTNLAAGETCAIYSNSGDLGFGREMHCKKTGANVGCYVTNYGNIDTPDIDDVNAAVLGTAKIATVAMENAPIDGDPSGDMVVKFFVYVYDVNGVAHPEGARVNAANLDGKGIRPVPQLCMVCHGGHYAGGPNTGVPSFGGPGDFSLVKLGSEFLAFDLHNFNYAAAPFDKASQQDEFKILNEQMVLPGNAGAHTQLYVAEMYDGDNGVPTTDQEELLVIDDPSAPAASDRWSAQPLRQEMYKHVVGNSCRTCHATNPVPELTFVNGKQVIDILGGVESRVCSERVMPHAKVTHDLFWNSVDRPDTPFIDPHQPGVLQTFGDTFGNAGNFWQGNLCGEFTGGSPSPPSAFNDIRTQIFTPQCASCHQGGSPPGNLNLQSGNAYAQIVGISSCGRPSMQRVEAGSANNSFLYRKVEGTHSGLGGCDVTVCGPFGSETGCGFQMPWTGAVVSTSPLSGTHLNMIRDWINMGAPN